MMQIHHRFWIYPHVAALGHLLPQPIEADPTFRKLPQEKAEIFQVHVLIRLVTGRLHCQNLSKFQQHSPVPPSPAKTQ